uniref:[Histone H3]-trimethyl-L-lysine(9) demethylase n=1 Tax=Ditylenchus dipsaci TaxID=166011 RepID=A0A915EWL1_9BILA
MKQNIIYTKQQEWVNTGTQEIMVFHPTMDEFKDFSGLIKKIEQKGAHLVCCPQTDIYSSGICKIVPPKEWNPRPSRPPGDYSDTNNYIIHGPVKETIEGTGGSFTKSLKVHRKKMPVKDFRKIALSKEMSNPKPDCSLAELERHYWRNILLGEPIYGADTPGSLYDKDVKEFNMNKLNTILDLLNDQKIKIHGVNTVFLYFGMWKTTFPWHSEDMDLYSINYLHYGEPKFWYSIPSQAAEKFERLASQQFPDGSMICKAFLRHKIYIISPNVLRSHSIPYGTMVQYPNEFIITFPKGYHMGFNTGFNCAESTNFAIERWIDYGKNSVMCYCRPDGVEIDMRPFMLKFRPDEFASWNQYWYGERHSSLKESKKKRRSKQALAASEVQPQPQVVSSSDDLVLEERQKKVLKAKRNVKDLWSNLPVNLFVEKEYNAKCSKSYPHCSVCQYLVPRSCWADQRRQPTSNGHPNNNGLPKKSRRFIRNQLFYKDEELSDVGAENEDEDMLLECKNCRVVVHKNCYPEIENVKHNSEEASTSDPENKEAVIRSVSCCLCELRGGALVETTDAVGVRFFVHVICAIMDSKTTFLEPSKRAKPFFPHLNTSFDFDISRSDIENCDDCAPSCSALLSPSTSSSLNYSLLSPKHNGGGQYIARFQCEMCSGQAESLVQCDVCLAANEAGASLRYHITCAALVDMSFERRNFPKTIVAVCSFHNSSQAISSEDDRNISIGERVIVSSEDENDASNSAPIVKKGRVVGTSESLYCSVDFLDGSISTDIFVSDVKNCECHKFGCKGNHFPGSLVYVEWQDGKMYEAYFRGKAPVKKFAVEIDSMYANGSSKDQKEVVEVTQDNVFRLDEALPEEIRLALLKRTSAGETRHF